MRVDLTKVSECAERFRNYDPQLYGQFARLLAEWSYEVTVAVTEAPADQVLNAQGRAQQMRKVYQILIELADTSRKPTP